MLFTDVMRPLGESLRARMVERGVDRVHADGWHRGWALLVADAQEDLTSPVEIGGRMIQGLTHARELCRIYGRDD